MFKKTMAEENVCGKTAKIGPMRAIQTDLFAPVKPPVDEDEGGGKAARKAKISMLISRIAVSLIRHLKKFHSSEYEVQNVLTYAVKTYVDNVRIECMEFVEAVAIEHTWEGMLTWWNHRDYGTDFTPIMVYNERVAIHGYKGREKVMRIARMFTPTFSDIAATDKIIKERMTVPYRQTFVAYLARYGLPKCLRMIKLWVWDIKSTRELPPDPTEDGVVQERHLRDILAKAHDYDGVSTFPKIGKESDRKWSNSNKRQRGSASPSSSYQAAKVIKISLSDDEEEGNQQQQPPLPPTIEPVTPPRPPPPQDDNDAKPIDPRLNRDKERAGKMMGFDLYSVENVVKNMSVEDWVEFLTRQRYGMSLIKELQAFLNEKYCNEENTDKQKHYGQLCNISMYPSYYPPYELDVSAKQYHMRSDGEIPSYTASTTPKTFYMRKFGGSSFPVYMTNEEYDQWFFRPHEMAVEDHSHPTGYYKYTRYPTYPAPHYSCTQDGDDVIYVRNMPRKEAQKDNNNEYEVDE